MIRRIANAVKWGLAGWTNAGAGRVFRYDPNLDTLRSHLTKRITFAKLDRVLRGGDDGDITEALQLFEEIEASDLRLRNLANTRRLAVSGLDYEIVGAAEEREGVDQKLADDAAAYARETIEGLKGFRKGLKHLPTAIGPNLAVLETVWEYGRPVEVVPIPTWRLTMNLRESLDIRVLTTEDRTYGVVADGPKFMVHVPNSKCGSPLAHGISRATAWIWLFKKLALSDWGTFCEIFGMPVRVGKYPPNASSEEKNALKEMLQGLGSNAWAMVSSAVTLDLAESSQRGTSPYEAFMNALNRELAIGWLGGNLTSDTTGGTGTYAAAEVQDQVREDLRDDDIKSEEETLDDQFLAPLVTLKFGPDTPVPHFRRITPDNVDRVLEGNVMRVAQAAGVQVPRKWAYERLGIPEPEEGEAILEPVDAFEAGVTEGGGAGDFGG